MFLKILEEDFYRQFIYICLLSEVHVFYDRHEGELMCEGLYLHLPITEACNISPPIPMLIEESCKFLPYSTNNVGDIYF